MPVVGTSEYSGLTPVPNAASPKPPQMATPPSLSLSPTSTQPTMDNDSIFVSRILTNDLIHNIVLGFSPPPALYCLARTCRAAHTAVHWHIDRSYKINAHLSEYFTHPLAFRSMQARTGTFISGSNALQFLARTTYNNSDLDLYCGWEQREEVGRWLMREEGYSFCREENRDFDIEVQRALNPDEYCDVECVLAVYSFLKRVVGPDGETERSLKVQIIVGYPCAAVCVFHFHSTAVMNIITATHAYSLYPRATFQHKVSLSMQSPEVLNPAIVTKYTNRGYRFLHKVPVPPRPQSLDTSNKVPANLSASKRRQRKRRGQRQGEDRSIAGAFPDVPRWIGDRFSWVLPLDTAGLELPAGYQRDPSYFTSWNMVPRTPDGDGLARAREMQYTVMNEMPGFAYAYVVGHERMEDVMRAVQELYHKPLEGKRSGPVSCDAELVRWTQMMLGEMEMWAVWFPGP